MMKRLCSVQPVNKLSLFLILIQKSTSMFKQMMKNVFQLLIDPRHCLPLRSKIHDNDENISLMTMIRSDFGTMDMALLIR